jgi:hypothetical protein
MSGGCGCCRCRFELRNSFQRPRPERCGIGRDCCFPGSGALRNAPVECGNQFFQVADGCGAHRHRRPPGWCVRDRDTFQTSPHFVHRQYVSASGIFAVVTIDEDWHAGQTTGVVLAGIDVGGNEFGYATGPPRETALVRAGWPERPQGSIKQY